MLDEPEATAGLQNPAYLRQCFCWVLNAAQDPRADHRIEGRIVEGQIFRTGLPWLNGAPGLPRNFATIAPVQRRPLRVVTPLAWI